MAVISFSEKPEEVWCVAGWAFRQILDDVIAEHTQDVEMKNKFEHAKMISGLIVELSDIPLAGRIKNAIREVATGILAGTVRSGIAEKPYGDAATVEQYLGSLKGLLAALSAHEQRLSLGS